LNQGSKEFSATFDPATFNFEAFFNGDETFHHFQWLTSDYHHSLK
jgi:hypothetical protein